MEKVQTKNAFILFIAIPFYFELLLIFLPTTKLLKNPGIKRERKDEIS